VKSADGRAYICLETKYWENLLLYFFLFIRYDYLKIRENKQKKNKGAVNGDRYYIAKGRYLPLLRRRWILPTPSGWFGNVRILRWNRQTNAGRLMWDVMKKAGASLFRVAPAF
jgi:hypothetical protein